MNIKKYSFVMFLVGFLSGCGSNIDLVKNGYLSFNKTTTVGQALDNWRACESKKWEELKTAGGVNIVQFTCKHKISQYFDKMKKVAEEEGGNSKNNDILKYMDVVSYVQTFQFTINNNKTFQPMAAEGVFIWKDGKKFNKKIDPVEYLQMAYADELVLNPTDLDNVNVLSVMANSFLNLYLSLD